MRQTFWQALRNFDDVAGMLFMAFIILLACANVFMRYVVGRPWGWVEEVTLLTFVWLIMLGSASVVKAEGHCSIDVLARKLPPGPGRVLAVVIDIIVDITLLLLIWYGMELALSAGTKLTPILGIPYTYIDLAVPIGSALMLMYYLEFTWRDITGRHDAGDGKER